jgi:hypothetical protein
MTGAEMLDDGRAMRLANEELAAALENAASFTNANSFRLQRDHQEAERRKRAAELARPFSKGRCSATQYLWKRLSSGFGLSVVAGLLV